jgi:undecaprenyl-diphosphatase
MLESIKSFDEKLFLILNSHHNAFFDQVMWLFSNIPFWIPLYVLFLWLLYKEYPKQFWSVLVVILLMIVVSDQLCNLAKYGVMRLRPTHDPNLQALVHTVKGYQGGMYSFYSGHASNSFTVAFFIINTLKAERKYIIPIALCYAIFTSYSRIYLGVHYPFDVLTGAIIGAMLGTIFAYSHNQIRKHYFAHSI